MQFISATEIPQTDGRVTKVWNISPKSALTDTLGVVKWYAPWRRYTFSPMPDLVMVFDAACLSELASFCLEQTLARKGERDVQKPAAAGVPAPDRTRA